MAQPAISANERALLNTIRYAEGTASERGYSTMFGGGQFDPSKGHPNHVVRSGGYASAAAGAYQFMPDTWNAVSKQLGLADFSPDSQDRAALQLVRNRGVDPTKPLTTDALAKLAPEWASLPTAAGKSYYGQPVKGHKELFGVYSRSSTAANSTAANSTAAGSTASPTGATGATGATGGLLPGLTPFPRASGDDIDPVDPADPMRPRSIGDETNSPNGASPNGASPNGASPMLAALRRNTELLNTPNPYLRTSGSKKPETKQRMAGGIANLLSGFQSLLAA
jgi:muramidase (phage lysozyme)